MASHRKSFQTSQKNEDINISPLIDMVFILLIFFIVTTTFVDERGFEASKPDQSSESDSDNEPTIFLITKNGDITVKGENVGIAGVSRVIRNNASVSEEELPVIIQVQEGARASTALKVFDESLRAGAPAVNLAQAK